MFTIVASFIAAGVLTTKRHSVGRQASTSSVDVMVGVALVLDIVVAVIAVTTM